MIESCYPSSAFQLSFVARTPSASLGSCHAWGRRAKNIQITLDIYSHILPDMQDYAANRIDTLSQNARQRSK